MGSSQEVAQAGSPDSSRPVGMPVGKAAGVMAVGHTCDSAEGHEPSLLVTASHSPKATQPSHTAPAGGELHGVGVGMEGPVGGCEGQACTGPEPAGTAANVLSKGLDAKGPDGTAASGSFCGLWVMQASAAAESPDGRLLAVGCAG